MTPRATGREKVPQVPEVPEGREKVKRMIEKEERGNLAGTWDQGSPGSPGSPEEERRLGRALLGLIEQAKRTGDGTFTLMGFTTGFKVQLGTPEMTQEGRAGVWCLAAYDSCEEALRRMARP